MGGAAAGLRSVGCSDWLGSGRIHADFRRGAGVGLGGNQHMQLPSKASRLRLV